MREISLTILSKRNVEERLKQKEIQEAFCHFGTFLCNIANCSRNLSRLRNAH